MKTPDTDKRTKRYMDKVAIRDNKSGKFIPSIRLNKMQKQPITVMNNTTRLIFVAHQPVRVTTTYHSNYKQ